MKKKSILTSSILLLALLLAGCTKTGTSSSEVSSEEVSSEDTVVHVTGVEINPVDSTELVVEDTLQLSATVLPADATDKTVSWSSSDANIASVSESGLVTANGVGNATITVTTTDGNFSDSLVFTINPKIIHVSSVAISASTTTVEVGDTLALAVEVLPADATDKTVNWASSNTDVATVSESGVVTGLKMGETTISATSVDGNISDSITIRVEKHFSITTTEIVGVSIVAPTSALVGELVEVEVTSSTLLIDAVYANTVKCGTMNGKYFFFMPNEEVTINVSTSVASISHAIVNGNSQVVTLSASSCEVGEVAEVSFTLAPGYDLAGVVVNGNINAFDPEDMTVIESTVSGNVVSFTMPDEDVKVTVNVTAHYYSLSVASDTYSSLNSVYVDGSSTSKVGGVYRIPYNASVKINFYGSTSSNSYKAIGSGILIKETNTSVLAEEGNTYVEFIMPHRNISIDVLTSPVYRDITLVNSEHITLSLFKKVDTEYVALENNSAIYEDTVYVLATSTSEDYSVYQLTGSYYKQGSSYSSNLTIKPVNEDGYYSFEMPLSEKAKCTLTVSECNTHLFAGLDLVGDYAGYNAYSNNFFDEGDVGSAKSASIMENGTITHKNTDVALASSVDENGTITTTDGKLFHYENNILVTKWTPNTDAYISSDMQMYFKLMEGTSVADYTYTLACSSGKYFLLEVYDNEGTLYASALVDVSSAKLYTNIQINYESGSRLNEVSNGSLYTSDGKYIIDFSSTGSKVTFAVVDPIKGTYTDDSSNTLLLDGTGNATYNENTWAYTVSEDGVTVTLVRYDSTNKHTVVVTIDKTAKTFTLVSSEDASLPAFTGNVYYALTSYNYCLKLDFTTPGTVKLYTVYEPNNTYASSTSVVTGWSFDEATNELVINTSNNGILTATYNSSTDTFTITCDFTTTGVVSSGSTAYNLDTYVPPEDDGGDYYY